MENKKIEKKLEQRLPEGTFATCAWLRVTDHWCTKYNNDAKLAQPDWRYDHYCMSDGGCDR